jgi:hypothetical protein
MVDWLFYFILIQATVIGCVLVLLGLVGLRPRGYLVLVFSTIEISLFVQLAVSVGIVIAGQTAALSTVEYFGYLIVALLVPLAGAAWALMERTRWSTVILGATSLTISVMLLRMWQIWEGSYPF